MCSPRLVTRSAIPVCPAPRPNIFITRNIVHIFVTIISHAIQNALVLVLNPRFKATLYIFHTSIKIYIYISYVQNVVELLDDLFQRAAAAPGESPEMNFIKKHSGSMKVYMCGRG